MSKKTGEVLGWVFFVLLVLAIIAFNVWRFTVKHPDAPWWAFFL